MPEIEQDKDKAAADVISEATHAREVVSGAFDARGVLGRAAYDARHTLGGAESDARDILSEAESEARRILSEAAAEATQVLLAQSHDLTGNAATEAAGALTTAADTLSTGVGGLRDQMAKNRRQFRLALILLVIAIGIVAWVGINARQTAGTAKAAANQGITNQQANYNTCIANNEYRAGSKTLWTAAISTFVNPSNTAATTATIHRMQAMVDTTFAPRNCKAVK